MKKLISLVNLTASQIELFNLEYMFENPDLTDEQLASIKVFYHTVDGIDILLGYYAPDLFDEEYYDDINLIVLVPIDIINPTIHISIDNIHAYCFGKVYQYTTDEELITTFESVDRLKIVSDFDLQCKGVIDSPEWTCLS